MSVDEQTYRIGEAAVEYQAAKVECARIELRIERVFQAYQYAGDTMDARRGSIQEPKLVEGKIVIGPAAFKFRTADLLSDKALSLLLAERDKARHRLSTARETLNHLGIVNIG
jgi:hypothetical protein